MLTFITVLHFVVAILLIVFVLLQDAKSGGVFGMSGSGGSNQVFSATGAANFFVKATRVLAVLFAITCISLTVYTSKKEGSVVDDFVPAATPAANDPTAPAQAPATPANAAPQESSPQNSETK